MTKKFYIKFIPILILGALLFSMPQPVLATAVDRMALCNLEGHAGETIQAQITLEGNEVEDRTGFWSTYYKQVEGDNERMDITPWITVTPEEYTLAQEQSLDFTVMIKIPDDASPGLWGATSEEAAQTGHSGERRTYLIFKDTPTGGNVYSGLLIPVSVIVLGEDPPSQSEDQTWSLLNFIQENLIAAILGAVVVILVVIVLVLMLRKRAY